MQTTLEELKRVHKKKELIRPVTGGKIAIHRFIKQVLFTIKWAFLLGLAIGLFGLVVRLTFNL